jgi:hypothetical protein
MFPIKKRDTKGLYRFGQYTFYGRKHAGQDYRANDDEFFLPFSGKVRVGYGFEGGYFLELTRDNGDVITGRHFKKLLITNGHYEAGKKAAITGNTGAFTTAPHLHLEVKKKGVLMDPEAYDWITYPIQPRVTILMNYSMPWKTNEEVNKVFDWFFEKSGGRIDFRTKSGILYSSFKGWDIEYMSSGDGTFAPAIKVSWLKEYVYPLALPKSDVVTLVLPNAAWHDQIFNMPGMVEGGACYSDKPTMIITVADEGKMSSNFPQNSEMFDFLRHELAHYLYKNGQTSGFDFTHRHYAANEMEKMFADLDFSKLNLSLNEPSA